MIHPSADVSISASVGQNSKIWNHAQVREGVHVGENCIVGKDVYIDSGVQIGDNVKIQNGAYLYHGTTIESGVFVGPGVIFTNDRLPRAINVDGTPKTDTDWLVGDTRVCYGASIGAGAVILPDVTVGQYALVGAGAIVTQDVPPHALVVGNPARMIDYVCTCARRLIQTQENHYTCESCNKTFNFGGE